MPAPHDDVLFTEVDGVETVLVDLNSKQYFQLNETATVVWRALQKGTPVDEIAVEMTKIYDVTLEHARSSVDAVIREFGSYRLLKP